jgi:predicted MFS family arabinose efflux permease
MVAVGYAFALGSASVAFLVTLAIPMLLVGRFVPGGSDATGDAPAQAPRSAVHTQISQGLGFLWRQPLLRTMALTLTVLCLCWGAWLAIIPVLATRTLHLDSRGYGLILSALGIGGFVGAVISSPLSRAFGRRWVMFGDIIGTFAMVAVPVLTPNPYAVGTSAFLGGMGGTLWTVNARTLSQRLVPPDMMGRFHSAWRLFSWGALPIGSGLVGVFADLVGVRASFLPFAVAVALLVVPFLRILTPQAITAAEKTHQPHCPHHRSENTPRHGLESTRAPPRASAVLTSQPAPATDRPAPEKGILVTAIAPQSAHDIEARLIAALHRLLGRPVTAQTVLAEAGLDSLTMLRGVVAVLGEDADVEVDPSGLGALRTVADLRDWLVATLERVHPAATAAS